MPVKVEGKIIATGKLRHPCLREESETYPARLVARIAGSG